MGGGVFNLNSTEGLTSCERSIERPSFARIQRSGWYEAKPPLPFRDPESLLNFPPTHPRNVESGREQGVVRVKNVGKGGTKEERGQKRKEPGKTS